MPKTGIIFKHAVLLSTVIVAAILSSSLPRLGHAQALAPNTRVILCRGCHADKFAALTTNPHAAIDSEQWRTRMDVAVACESCHGNVDEHIRAGGGLGNVFAFREEADSLKRTRCLTCHSDTHPRFEQSPHARAGLTCLDCHSQHSAGAQAHALLRASPEPRLDGRLAAETEICFDCHGEIFAQFAATERHRLLEGSIDCVSCHDPHEPQTRQMLGGFKQALCESCHADKTGPFVFEHPVSRTEGCTACHSPHGSPNRHLLAHQRVAELCFGCHALVPQFHLGSGPAGEPRFGLGTQCTNCHSAIHGSNFSEFFLR
jgi:DmsE family decaheme c-type cytochrome